MKTQFLRLLFENTEKGLCHTIHMEDERTGGGFLGCCLSGTSRDIPERFREYGKETDLLVLGDLEEDTLNPALELAGRNSVKLAVIPEDRAIKNAEELLKAAGVKEVCTLSPGESRWLAYESWQMFVGAWEAGERRGLVCFHGPADSGSEDLDCQMSVKPITKNTPCSAVMEESHRCGLACSHYRDVQICKAHNDARVAEYKLGTLFLGNAKPSEIEGFLKEELEEKLEEIRFLAAADPEAVIEWDQLAMNTEETTIPWVRYYLLPLNGGAREKAISSIMEKGPYQQPVLLGKDYGLCASAALREKIK